jgi:hypothetical protein
MKILFLISFIILSKNLLAEQERGGWSSGGGNALVCFKKTSLKKVKSLLGKGVIAIPDWALTEIATIETLDLYTAKLPRGFDSVLPEILPIGEKESFSAYINRVKNRFDKSVSFAKSLIEQGQDLIYPENIRIQNSEVMQINDVNEVSALDFSRCTLSTMALQRNWDGFHELYIDARLFHHEKHTRLSQAVLYLHEYIYAVGKLRGHTDSSNSRKLVEYLISYDPSFTQVKMLKLLSGLDFHDQKYFEVSDIYKLAHTFSTLLMKDANEFVLDHNEQSENLDQLILETKALFPQFDFSAYSPEKLLEFYNNNPKNTKNLKLKVKEHIEQRAVEMLSYLDEHYSKNWLEEVSALKLNEPDYILASDYLRMTLLSYIKNLSTTLNSLGITLLQYHAHYYLGDLNAYVDQALVSPLIAKFKLDMALDL